MFLVDKTWAALGMAPKGSVYTRRMKAPAYAQLVDRACERKGSRKAVEAMLPKPAARRALRSLGSDRYLAEFTRKIFQSGFVWRVVDQKWPGFEDIFWGFDVDRLVLMPDDMLERKAREPAIIRNLTKVKTVRDNAMMIADTERRENCRFGEFVAAWPTDDIVGLWLYLKRHGSRLGGNTGPFALRALGVDTFLLTADVEGFLRNHDVIDSGISSRRALEAAQAYFNGLRAESGRSLSELSRLVSLTFGANRAGLAPAAS
jgi:3-methyladenine DNA glycosylase Tag